MYLSLTSAKLLLEPDLSLGALWKGAPWVSLNVRARQKGDSKREKPDPEPTFSQIFADFCRFSLIFGLLCKSRELGVADLRRKPQENRRFSQETAGNRRFLQKPVSPICCLPFGALLQCFGPWHSGEGDPDVQSTRCAVACLHCGIDSLCHTGRAACNKTEADSKGPRLSGSESIKSGDSKRTRFESCDFKVALSIGRMR